MTIWYSFYIDKTFWSQCIQVSKNTSHARCENTQICFPYVYFDMFVVDFLIFALHVFLKNSREPLKQRSFNITSSFMFLGPEHLWVWIPWVGLKWSEKRFCFYRVWWFKSTFFSSVFIAHFVCKGMVAGRVVGGAVIKNSAIFFFFPIYCHC